MVSETLHMRIPRSGNRPTQDSVVKENIAKAQRTLYSLMASRLYGENGLDPETCTHLLQICVLPVLVYGLKVVLPKLTLVRKLSGANKKILKQVLSIPIKVADSAVYILSDALPIKGVILKRALMLCGSVCRLQEDSTEKQLTRRQLTIKGFSSNNWFMDTRKIHVRYDLPSRQPT